METGKSVARLRFVRDLLGRTASEGEGDAEGGFTLIELMVVLLIMGILLAIAIPTFLSVTGSASKTAAQSNLTDAVTSATAIYTNTTGFPTTTTGTTTLANKLHKTQNTIDFVSTATIPPTEKGKNYIAVRVLTSSGIELASLDGKTVCWVVTINEGGTTLTGGISPGDHYYGKLITTGNHCGPTLVAPTTTTPTTGGWSTSFSGDTYLKGLQ